MENITTTLKGIGIAFLLLIQSSPPVIAGGCSECGLSSIGTLSGPTTTCPGQAITFTFSGATCLYSGCSLLKQIKVYSGTLLVFTSTASSSNTHSFTPSGTGTFTVYGYVRASGYSPWCATNSKSFTSSSPGTPTSICGSITACEGENFSLSATPASGTTLKWYKGTTLIGTGNPITYSEATSGTYTYKAYSYNSTSGCQSVNGLSVNATISDAPANLIINSNATGTMGESFTISGSATGTGLTYSWNFGSGASPATGSGTGPFNVTYNSVGTKTITLTVTNCYGCIAVLCKTIKICGKAEIVCPPNACKNTNIQFTATNAGTNATYSWNFGTGASPLTATGIGPHNVSYSTSGSKTITLTVGNSTIAECSDIDTKTISISDVATGLTITSLNTVLVGDALTVSGSATGTGNTFSWNFGSGATPATAIQGPILLHNTWTSSTGAYSFTNTAGNNRLLVLTVGMENDVEVNLTGVTYGGRALTQAVEKTVITGAPSYNRVEIWYLKEADLALAGTGSKAFTFTWSGVPDYTMYSAAVFSNVNQATPIGNTQSREGTADPMAVSSPLLVDANDMVIVSGVCGNEGSYLSAASGYTQGVDFTNAATSTFANYYKLITVGGSESPSMDFSGSVNRQGIAALVLNGFPMGNINVVYSTIGSKTITLTVTNSIGCSASITKTISVCGEAVINCPTSNCTNTSMQFYTTELGGGSVYNWNFGLNAIPATATGIGPHNVTYSAAGSKSVSLTVTNSTMPLCNNVASRTVVINESPSASIDGPTTGSLNTNYTFTTPAVSGATYVWNIPSDGIVVSGAGTTSIVIKWPTNGTKTFAVTVTKNGCIATDNHTIIFESCPSAIINPVSDICKTNAQTFSTVNQGAGVTYAWNFGSGASPATAATIGPHSVNYSTSGIKTCSLTVSKTGCTNKIATATFNVNVSLGTIAITPPPFNIYDDTALTYTATLISGATYVWSATGGATITGTGNSVQILFPTPGSQTITVHVSKNGCTAEATLCITVKTPICKGLKLNHTQVPLKTSMKNYTFTHSTGNWLKFKKATYSTDSFHTSRKFQRNRDTAISWQELSSTTSTASIKFNRSASDFRFFIRDLNMPTTGFNEIITVKAYYKGALINTSSIEATFNTANIQMINNTGTQVSYKGLVYSCTDDEIIGNKDCDNKDCEHKGNCNVKTCTSGSGCVHYTDDNNKLCEYKKCTHKGDCNKGVCNNHSTCNHNDGDKNPHCDNKDCSHNGNCVSKTCNYNSSCSHYSDDNNKSCKKKKCYHKGNCHKGGCSNKYECNHNKDVHQKYCDNKKCYHKGNCNLGDCNYKKYCNHNDDDNNKHCEYKKCSHKGDCNKGVCNNGNNCDHNGDDKNDYCDNKDCSHSGDCSKKTCNNGSNCGHNDDDHNKSCGSKSCGHKGDCNAHGCDHKTECDHNDDDDDDGDNGEGFNCNDIGFYFSTKIDSVQLIFSNTTITGTCIKSIGISKMSWCITEPLPVTWLSINAVKNSNEGINVNWATASEINSNYFSVEKSTDSKNFNEIGTVKGSGNKNTISKYVFPDNAALLGTVYYRIKQIDYSGEFIYSDIVVVNPGKLLNNVTMNPNPASTNVTFTWDAGIKEQLTLQVTDLSGVVLISEPLPNANNVHYLDTRNIKSGLYLVNILSNTDMVYRSRIVIAR